MTYKKFLSILLGSLLLYISFHLLVWNLYSKKIFGLSDKESVGDLARLSYRPDMTFKKTLEYTLPKSHLHNKNFTNQKLDLITIGDSFSYGGGFGKNPFYQDFLASQYNINVLNIGTKNISEYIETAVNLHNKGFFKEHPTKYLLLESVVRLTPMRFAKDIKWEYNKKIILRKKMKNIYHQDIDFINTINYKIVMAKIEHTLLGKNPTHGIYNFETDKQLFSLSKKNILIYYSDIENLVAYKKDIIHKMNNNLNKLAKILKQDNVQLIVMPVVDKYDLYYTHLLNNKYPKNNFFDLMRDEKKEYLFVDTKKILSKLLKKNEKDIFYIDDTHWSDKASKAISDAKLFHTLFEDKKEKN